MITCVASGGSGSRMSPASRFCNKHLVLVGRGKLMIDMPLHFIAAHGVQDVIVVTGSNHASQIVDYVQDGDAYGFNHVDYAFQPTPAGIADVLKRISHKDTKEGVMLILADNYFSSTQSSIAALVAASSPDGAMAFQYDVGTKERAKRFGQVIFNENAEAVDIVEKPKTPQHTHILTGLYYFPADVFERVEELSPSARGELEITDLLKMYLNDKKLTVKNVVGKWSDLGEQETWAEFVSQFSTGALPVPQALSKDSQLSFDKVGI